MKKYDILEEKIARVVSQMQETELSQIPEDGILEQEYPVAEELQQKVQVRVKQEQRRKRRRIIKKTLATAAIVAIAILAGMTGTDMARAKQFVVRWIEEKTPDVSELEEWDTETMIETETTTEFPMRGSAEKRCTYRMETRDDGETYVYKSRGGQELLCSEEFLYGFHPDTGVSDTQGITCYVGPEGYLYQNGWFIVKYGEEYQWRFFDDTGELARGWRHIEGEWYYFNYDGIPLRDQTLEQNGETYRFDSEGRWIPEEEELVNDTEV